MIHPVKDILVGKHLDAMLEIDKKLYEQILDTAGFAYHFNEICNLAREGKTLEEEYEDTVHPPWQQPEEGGST